MAGRVCLPCAWPSNPVNLTVHQLHGILHIFLDSYQLNMQTRIIDHWWLQLPGHKTFSNPISTYWTWSTTNCMKIHHMMLVLSYCCLTLLPCKSGACSIRSIFAAERIQIWHHPSPASKIVRTRVTWPDIMETVQPWAVYWTLQFGNFVCHGTHKDRFTPLFSPPSWLWAIYNICFSSISPYRYQVIPIRSNIPSIQTTFLYIKPNHLSTGRSK